MLTGMGSREQPLMLYITTAGANTSGPCYSLQLEAQRMLDGVTPDEELFALVYGTDQDDDWTDPAMLQKANPNYGISVAAEFLLSRHRDAMTNAREQGAFQTKHLNRWVGARSAFFDLPKWIACKRDIKLEDFAGRTVRLGLDLASTVDVNALVLLFRDEREERYTVFGRYYLPEATVELGSNQHYQAWAREGRLVATPGEMVDMERIRDDVLELAARFDVAEIAYDPFQATMLVTQLMNAGLSCVEVRPTVLNFSAPMKRLDGLIRAGRIEHDGDPVLTWMMGNVVALADAKDNVYPRKEQRESKIDAVVALLSALARDMAAPAESAEISVYEKMVEQQAADRPAVAPGSSWWAARTSTIDACCRSRPTGAPLHRRDPAGRRRREAGRPGLHAPAPGGRPHPGEPGVRSRRHKPGRHLDLPGVGPGGAPDRGRLASSRAAPSRRADQGDRRDLRGQCSGEGVEGGPRRQRLHVPWLAASPRLRRVPGGDQGHAPSSVLVGASVAPVFPDLRPPRREHHQVIVGTKFLHWRFRTVPGIILVSARRSRRGPSSSSCSSRHRVSRGVLLVGLRGCPPALGKGGG